MGLESDTSEIAPISICYPRQLPFAGVIREVLMAVDIGRENPAHSPFGERNSSKEQVHVG